MYKQEKTKVAQLSILSNTSLIIMKIIVGVFTGSVSIISEAIHSLMDLLAAIIAFFSVKISGNPPDSRHPYGHGKVENVSGVIEALLIFAAAFWIIYEAVHKLVHPSNTITAIEWGALVMLISAGINTVVSRKIYKVAKKTDSIALEADALHLKADVYTSLGVALALFLIWITGWHILDPIVAILVAIFILKEAFILLKKASMPMFDEAWNKDELDLLTIELDAMQLSYHDVKTRKAGSYRFLEFHLNVDPTITVLKSHNLCDEIENKLKDIFPDVTITIHVEPLFDKDNI